MQSAFVTPIVIKSSSCLTRQSSSLTNHRRVRHSLHNVLSHSIRHRTIQPNYSNVPPRVNPSMMTKGIDNDNDNDNKNNTNNENSKSISNNNNGGSDPTLPPYETLFLKGPVPGDRLVRTISSNGEVSCYAVTCTGLVNGVSRLHRTSPTATTALGRAIACALLLASGKKGDESLQIEFRGNGPLKGMTVIANGVGEVRGYVGNPFVSLPLRNGQFDVSNAIGKGILAVVRSSPFAKLPYTGLVPINSGEVAQDLTLYLAESEQTHSALAAGVYIEPDGRVTAAAGYLVQLLPGATKKTIEILERNLRLLGSAPTELVRNGQSPDNVIQALMTDLDPVKVAGVSPRYRCKCGKDRLKRTVALLSSSEIEDVLSKHGKIEAKCEFCGQTYDLQRDEIDVLLSQAKDKS